MDGNAEATRLDASDAGEQMNRFLFILFFVCLALVSEFSFAGQTDQTISLAVSKKDNSIVLVVLNPGPQKVRIGPMVYGSVLNDISVFGSRTDNLHLRSPIHMLPGDEEQRNWNAERYLEAGQIFGVVIPVSYLQKKYRESGCHDLTFTYGYRYVSGSTRSVGSRKVNICW